MPTFAYSVGPVLGYRLGGPSLWRRGRAWDQFQDCGAVRCDVFRLGADGRCRRSVTKTLCYDVPGCQRRRAQIG